MASLPIVRISNRAARRLRAGHVWVYRSDVQDEDGAQPGDIVQVVTKHRSGGTNSLGTAFFNPDSLIVLRLITNQVVIPDRDFWLARMLRAFGFRSGRVSTDTAARLVYSEGDEVPGLILDRYNDVLVLQTLCAGTERLKNLWVDLVSELLSPRAIVERNDYASRKLEGLEERCGVLAGRLDGPVEVLEGGLRLLVEPLTGQKTGYYLDQRENRALAAQYARGNCLDVFCYQGGFGLQLSKGGAERVTLVDQSERALEIAQATAGLNKLQVHTRVANAFDFLREQQAAGSRYDAVVLDPPAFAKNREAVERAARGYKEINLRSLRLLQEGGVLITSSCSYHMQPTHFEELLLEAARDAGRVVQILERRSQARDHPERLGFPESRYLKCFILRAL